MKKRVLTALAVWLCIAANTLAQVPSYVPTNGLVGWWPFNANANDESGNGNNGTVNGATLTTDRFGNINEAYNFNNQNITVPNFNIDYNDISISFWIKPDILNQTQRIVTHNWTSGSFSTHISNNNNSSNPYLLGGIVMGNNNIQYFTDYIGQLSTLNWMNFILVNELNTQKLYIDGQLVDNSVSIDLKHTIGMLYFGGDYLKYFGKIDDIGIWNRGLTEQEITALYQGCTVTANATPTTALTNTGANAQFTTPSISGATFQWQSNPANYGWSNVPNNASYSGGTTNSLTVSNVQLANQQQPFRVIASNGSCIDTSNVAYIQIADSCISNVTVYDTLYTTVTDTLIINTTLSLAPPNDQNTILIYPNPTSDHITIDNGNYAAMAGYELRIENNAGQQVFQSAINQAQFYLDLSTWTGNGLYFVHLIDPAGATVTVRKIVLQ